MRRALLILTLLAMLTTACTNVYAALQNDEPTSFPARSPRVGPREPLPAPPVVETNPEREPELEPRTMYQCLVALAGGEEDHELARIDKPLINLLDFAIYDEPNEFLFYDNVTEIVDRLRSHNVYFHNQPTAHCENLFIDFLARSLISHEGFIHARDVLRPAQADGTIPCGPWERIGGISQHKEKRNCDFIGWERTPGFNYLYGDEPSPPMIRSLRKSACSFSSKCFDTAIGFGGPGIRGVIFITESPRCEMTNSHPLLPQGRISCQRQF